MAIPVVAPAIHIFMSRYSREHPEWISVRMTKTWWSRPLMQTLHRTILETAFHRGTMTEAEMVETALREALRSWCDGQH